ncbi:mpv17-like protein [Lingula anatina]|uniref:Mpv17-like protein n=1 Tax=Lingula anatina TaxID=7574 RepID=A0A1S3H5Z8_LINAN|nr:mpv17-like protein [Lingula anatina]XP_013381408.1 mpv17-like protein [Lingula anatina]XP_013381409.1 mpv17-like protein [Lingula anatina]|eukprot:XP_013381407.1 mpv17-like protein [Lingula anatina]
MSRVRNFISGLWRRYPVLKSMLSYGTIYAAADINDQLIIDHKKREYHGTVTLRRSLAGFLFIGPLVFTWLRIADRIFLPNRSSLYILRRVFVEQLVFAPVAISAFYSSNNLLEGRSFEESWKELRDKFWTSFKAGCVYFPMVQFINYKYISASRRILFLSSATFLWSTFMCYMKNLPVQE